MSDTVGIRETAGLYVYVDMVPRLDEPSVHVGFCAETKALAELGQPSRV